MEIKISLRWSFGKKTNPIFYKYSAPLELYVEILKIGISHF
jgi:hypothetical protein